MHPYESVAPRTRKNVLCGTPTRSGDINLPGLAQFWTQHSAGRFSPSAGARTRPSHVLHAVEGSRFSTPIAGQVEDEQNPDFAHAISAPASPMTGSGPFTPRSNRTNVTSVRLPPHQCHIGAPSRAAFAVGGDAEGTDEEAVARATIACVDEPAEG